MKTSLNLIRFITEQNKNFLISLKIMKEIQPSFTSQIKVIINSCIKVEKAAST